MAPSIAAAVPVDLELVLAVDVSRSIDDAEYELQQEGYAAAFNHPSVLTAILSGEHRSIAVAMVQWAAYNARALVVPWMLIHDLKSASAFSLKVQRARRALVGGGTSLSGAIDYGSRIFNGNGYEGTRRVIDISGDGFNNNGRSPSYARDDAVKTGLTINALAILTDQEELDDYFRLQVVGGQGAFVMTAADFDSFAYAILNKLVREIADSGQPAPQETILAAHP